MSGCKTEGRRQEEGDKDQDFLTKAKVVMAQIRDYWDPNALTWSEPMPLWRIMSNTKLQMNNYPRQLTKFASIVRQIVEH